MSKSKKNVAAVVEAVAAIEPVAPVVAEPVAEPVAPKPALRTLATTGTVAEIWAYLADPANAGKESKDMRKELVAKGYNANTVSTQMFSFKRSNGNRHIGNAFLRNKEHGAAIAAKLAQ